MNLLATVFGILFYCTCIWCQHQGSKVYTVPSLMVLDAYEHTYFEIIKPTSLNYLFRIYPAKDFGISLKNNMRSFTGKLILSDPLDGCTTFKNKRKFDGAAALILRSGCSFLSKAVNAEEAGASFAIVTESLSSSEILDMVKDKSDRDVSIPVAFLSGNSGYRIVEALQKSETVGDIIITAPVNMSSTDLLLRQPPWTLW